MKFSPLENSSTSNSPILSSSRHILHHGDGSEDGCIVSSTTKPTEKYERSAIKVWEKGRRDLLSEAGNGRKPMVRWSNLQQAAVAVPRD